MSFSILQCNNPIYYTIKIKERKLGLLTIKKWTEVWPVSKTKEFISVPLPMDWVTRQAYHMDDADIDFFFVPIKHPVYIGLIIYKYSL